MTGVPLVNVLMVADTLIYFVTRATQVKQNKITLSSGAFSGSSFDMLSFPTTAVFFPTGDSAVVYYNISPFTVGYFTMSGGFHWK